MKFNLNNGEDKDVRLSNCFTAVMHLKSCTEASDHALVS